MQVAGQSSKPFFPDKMGRSTLEKPGEVPRGFFPGSEPDGVVLHERRHVEVGVAEVVEPLIVAQPVGIRVLVPQHGRVDVTRRPDVLPVGLQIFRLIALGGGVPRFEDLPRGVVEVVDVRVDAVGIVRRLAVDVALYRVVCRASYSYTPMTVAPSLASTSRFQASHLSESELASDAGFGTLVMFPARSCTGVAQAVPVVSVMSEISLTLLCVRSWSRSVEPDVFWT